MQLCAQPDEVFFQLREELFLIVELKIECLPELRLHPAAQGRLEGGVQRLHHVFQVHAGLRPADVDLFPGRDVVAGQIVLHLGFDDKPSAAGGLQKIAHLPFPADLLRQRVEGADQRFGVVDGAVVLGEDGAVVPLLLHGGQPQHRQMAHLPDGRAAEGPGHGLGRQAQPTRDSPEVEARQHDVLPPADGETTGLYDTAKLDVYDKYAMFLHGNNGLSRIKGDGTGRILVIKDSYANCFAPYLTANYADIDVVDFRNYNYGLDKLIADNDYDQLLVLYSFDSFKSDPYLYRAGVAG